MNRIIVDLTRNTLFTEVFDIPPYVETDPNDYYENPLRQKNTLYSSMADCQLVLRYFALKDDANIRSSMKSMLDRAMQKDMTDPEADVLRQEYIDRFAFLYTLFEKKPFLLPPDEKGRERISAALYDSSMVAIDKLWAHRTEIMDGAAGVRQRMVDAAANPNLLPILTGQGNTAAAVKQRIELVRGILRPE